ncbi:MAG: hypothetical protein V4684_09610 [Pseudomonadota bacterium]
MALLEKRACAGLRQASPAALIKSSAPSVDSLARHGDAERMLGSGTEWPEKQSLPIDAELLSRLLVFHASQFGLLDSTKKLHDFSLYLEISKLLFGATKQKAKNPSDDPLDRLNVRLRRLRQKSLCGLVGKVRKRPQSIEYLLFGLFVELFTFGHLHHGLKALEAEICRERFCAFQNAWLTTRSIDREKSQEFF